MTIFPYICIQYAPAGFGLILCNMNIQQVDLKGQYNRIKDEIDASVKEVIDTASFINGPKVKEFARNMESYTGAKHVIPCGNGTDALQMAFMALGLKPNDEVILPAFSYAAGIEAACLLGLTPVLADVDYNSFNLTLSEIKQCLTAQTKAIMVVHLFGQCCDMEPILSFAEKHSLYVVEDNAQAIGSYYTFSDGKRKQAGTMGHIGCTSFFPTKNLGCFGDGGALMTNDADLAERIAMIANHGQKVKYEHTLIGCNSRLDSIQAAILDVKLKYLNEYTQKRHKAAQYYSKRLKNKKGVIVPEEPAFSSHVYNQYTLKIPGGKRDALKQFLAEAGIPTTIYYPAPLHKQKAFVGIARKVNALTTAEELSSSVLSLPCHTEITIDQQDFITGKIKEFFFL